MNDKWKRREAIAHEIAKALTLEADTLTDATVAAIDLLCASVIALIALEKTLEVPRERQPAAAQRLFQAAQDCLNEIITHDRVFPSH